MVAITRKRGDTYADEITVKSKATGLPINITGYTFTMTLDPEKSPATAANNLYSLTGTIVDAPNGRVEFAPSALQADQTPGMRRPVLTLSPNCPRRCCSMTCKSASRSNKRRICFTTGSKVS